MLICPQCQFENPEHHRFCQQCGTSLILRPCPSCGADVPYQAEHCPSCGDRIGVLWLAIIQPLGSEPVETSSMHIAQSPPRSLTPDPDSEAVPADPSLSTPAGAVPSHPFPVGQYLDANQRYQVLEWLPTPPNTPYTCARVLDCKPLQLSMLDAIVAQDPPESQNTETDLEANGPSAVSATQQTEEMPTVPAIAEPYLLLPSRLGQVLPVLHDCWQIEDYAIALLEDRSNWPTLSDYWQSEAVSFLEVLHGLHEMVVLWTILEGWNCCQSLLEAQNLCLDEDQVLCLRQLYPDDPTATPTLAELGQVWKTLLEQSQTTLMGPVLDLLSDLEQAAISTPAALRSRIEALAQEIQQPDTDADDTIADTTAELPDWYGTPITRGDTTADLSLDVATGPLDLPDFSDIPGVQEILEERFAQEASDLGEDEDDEVATVALPMRLASIQEVGRTDVGCKRQRNEDYFSILSEQQKLETPLGNTVSARGVYVLCDGMGGHAGGEIASTLAADTLQQFFLDYWFNAEDEQVRQDLPSRELIIQGITLANQAIYEVNQENASAGSGRMGTTLILLLLQDSKVAIAHVGDSRMYRITRKQGLGQLTIDHEVGQQEIQRGVDPDIAYAHADAYQLTQALGPRDNDFIHPDIQFLDLDEDTLFLLCSDGLSDNNLVEENWQTYLLPLLSSRANLEEGAQKLIDLANQYNGHDNITVLLVRVKLQPHLDYLHQLGSFSES
ncbi:serine/threonine phosphatase [Trichothermofontia sp.]